MRANANLPVVNRLADFGAAALLVCWMPRREFGHLRSADLDFRASVFALVGPTFLSGPLRCLPLTPLTARH